MCVYVYIYEWYSNPVDLWVAGGMVGVVVVVVVSTSTDNTGISNQYAVHGTGPLGDTIGGAETPGGTALGESRCEMLWDIIGSMVQIESIDDIIHAPNCVNDVRPDVCQNGHWKSVTVQTGTILPRRQKRQTEFLRQRQDTSPN